MDKKGIMVKFLVTVLLAIIIFVPACMASSKFFRLSGQSKDNFVDFVHTIEDMKNDPDGSKETSLLIMDKGTAIVYFPPGSQEVQVAVDAEFPQTDYTIKLQNPGKCDARDGCFCLFRSPDFDTTWWKPGYDTVTVTDANAACQRMKIPLSIASCSIGTADDVNSYTCSNGFMVERHLADESSWLVGAFYKNPRRTQIQLTKQGNSIVLEG
jgi:hypothetical protein